MAHTITLRPTPTAKSFVRVLTEALRKWARVHSIDRKEPIVLTEEHFAIYGEALAHLTTEQLEVACLKAGQACRFFPKPADILAQLDGAAAKGFELEAEREWQRLMAWIRENVFPDTGIRRGAPELAPATQHAAKAAGGVFYLQRCDEDQLVWARKNFLAALKNVRDTKQTEHLLSDGEAKRIIRQLSSGPRSVRKSIAPAPANTSGKPSAGEVREFLKTVSAERPQVNSAASREDLEKNWQSQKERLASRAAELGIPTPPKNVSGPEATTR
ncbi:MAG: hypothetical protein WCC97_01965 [Candidatus Acidiferrales bacterium]